MKFNKTKDMLQVDNIMNDLDTCGDTYCGNIITSNQLKEESTKFLKKVLKKCRSTTKPNNEIEHNLQKQKYDTCFTKYKNSSKYYKKLTKRKKCEDKYCNTYQKQMQNKLSFIAKKSKTKKIHGK
jgi:hypothetical protein